MRKVALFLLLFVAGISVLRWIETPVARTEERGALASTDEGSPTPGAEPRDEVPATGSADIVDEPEPEPEPELPDDEVEGSRTLVTLSGPFEFTEEVEDGPYRGRRRYHLSARDSRTIRGREVELSDLRAVVYDETSGSEVLRIRAKVGRATVNQPSDIGFSEQLEFEEQIALQGVECTLLRNVPIAPLTLRAAKLDGGLGAGHFRTDGRVEIEGRGLMASGTGFELRIGSGMMRFERNGDARVDLDEARRATLTCAGELIIQETDAKTGRLKLDAAEDAVLLLTGDEGLELRGGHMTIGGRSRPGDESTLGFEEIDAAENVELRIRGSEFFADRAEIALTSPGTTHFRAELAGEPHGEILLTRRGDALDPIQGAFSIRFQGDGPLTVTRAAELAFALPGSAELDWRGARLTAAESVSGTFGTADEVANFVATGDVVIVRADGALETDEFRLRHSLSLDGQTQLTASAAGPARMEGDADEEHSFVLTTGETIEFALEGEAWHVPDARGVDLTVDGPRGFTARAERVLSFSQDPLSLEAQGGVALDSGEGSLRGERLSIRGGEQYVVTGSDDSPASFASPRWEWVAARVERTGPLMIADAVERASLTTEDGTYELAGRRLFVEEREETSADGVRTRGVRFTARDAVRAQAAVADGGMTLSCDVLEGDSARHSRDGAALWTDSSIRARGNVESAFQREHGRFELHSDELDVDRTDRGVEALSSGEIVARGNVEMVRQDDVEISGSGDRLEIDRLGRGTLSAEGDGRVRAQGALPGRHYPFEMTASWIHFSDVYLDAADVEMELQYERAGIEGGLVEGRARADLLEAREDSMQLSGRVALDGTDPEGTPWDLRSDRARIDVTSAAGRGILGGLQASGNVAFRLSETLDARGDEFTVRTTQRRVRIAGDPAVVVYQGMTVESTWVEYDLLVNLLRAGKNRIVPTPQQ